MRLTVLAIVAMALLAAPAARGAAESGADASVSFNDAFDGEQLDEKLWLKGGSYRPLHTVRDGSLRLVSNALQNSAHVTTRRDDFDFFAKPATVVWDLVPHSTLAGPYPATGFAKAYAGLTLGGVKDDAPAAQLGLTAWPEGFPRPKPGAKWFYTLNLGRLLPKDPDKDWRITGVPRRIVWSLDKTRWSVEIKGARFVTGDPHKRSAEHGLKAGDFADVGYHLKIYTSAHVRSMEPGSRHISGVVYTDRICVTSPEAIPEYTELTEKGGPPSQEALLKKLLGGPAPEKVKPQYLFGVQYCGGEFRPQKGFQVPKQESLDYYQSMGVLLMRLPMRWERLQRELNKPLDPVYLRAVKLTVKLMAERNIKVLLDLHNYGYYNPGNVRDGNKLIGTKEVPLSAFTDVWRRLAEAFKDEPAIWGYGLMNEPAIRKSEDWAKVVQAGIDGVRSVDEKTAIAVATCDIDATYGWSRSDAKLPQRISDPSNNLLYEAHCYFDSYAGGKYAFSYEYEINRPPKRWWPYGRVGPMHGVRSLKPFVEWLKANKLKGLIGELGVPANPDRDPRWLVILNNVYAYLGKNNIPSVYHAAGTLWTPGRSYVIEPYRLLPGPTRGILPGDRPQMKILLKNARDFQK